MKCYVIVWDNPRLDVRAYVHLWVRDGDPAPVVDRDDRFWMVAPCTLPRHLERGQA